MRYDEALYQELVVLSTLTPDHRTIKASKDL